MSGALKQMNEHVKAVKNVKKITHTMKLVAAAKFAKSEKSLSLARPLGMGTLYFYLFTKVQEELSAPHVSFLAITSDRGLCGSMHARVCKAVKSYMRNSNLTHNIVCVGEKAKSILHFEEGNKISLVVNGIGHRAPTFLDASRITISAIKGDDFMLGHIIYPKFVNMTSYVIDNARIYSLPILLAAKALLQYEMDSKEDLKSFLEFSQCSILYYTLCETYRVELSSRIMAMSSASKNAGTMVKKLELEVNRKRQQNITNELIDIVSGAQVLSKK